MKVPKYITTALQRRVRAAHNFDAADAVIRDFIYKKGIDVDPCDVGSGAEAYAHPRASAERIIQAIEDKEETAI